MKRSLTITAVVEKKESYELGQNEPNSSLALGDLREAQEVAWLGQCPYLKLLLGQIPALVVWMLDRSMFAVGKPTAPGSLTGLPHSSPRPCEARYMGGWLVLRARPLWPWSWPPSLHLAEDK